MFVCYPKDAPKLLAIASECKTIEKATDLDFINLKMNVRPKTRTMKCLTACLFEKVGKVGIILPLQLVFIKTKFSLPYWNS